MVLRSTLRVYGVVHAFAFLPTNMTDGGTSRAHRVGGAFYLRIAWLATVLVCELCRMELMELMKTLTFSGIVPTVFSVCFSRLHTWHLPLDTLCQMYHQHC